MTANATSSEAGYVALRRSRSEIVAQPTIIALPAPTPYESYGEISARRISDCLPDAIAAFIDWLVKESGWTVQENDLAVPVSPRHIAILFRRFRSFRTDVTRPYVRALEARRISHVLVGGRSFHDREEILALRNAMGAIEWPDDELKVFATLRGPFFALSDEALLVFRQYVHADGSLKTRRLNPIRAIDKADLDAASEPVADSLELLRRLHVGRNHRPACEYASRAVSLGRQPRNHDGARLLTRCCASAPSACAAAFLRVSGLLCHAVSRSPPDRAVVHHSKIDCRTSAVGQKPALPQRNSNDRFPLP